MNDEQLDDMAEGFIRETIGSDINEYHSATEDEKHGRIYTFETHILTDDKLSTLKERFEIVSIIPKAGESYFNVNVRRVQ